MASVVINGDTSGSVTLSAPAVAGTVTVTLPAASGTMATTAGLSSYATLATPSFTTTIGVGAATASASGSGITFPATQSASSNANTLDDYEEGTWTPTIVGGYTGVTYNNQDGWYTKVGRSVVISGRANFSGTTNAGQISVGGLPFSQGNLGGGAYGGGGIPYTTLTVITNTSPYCSGNTVEYYTTGSASPITPSGNASNQWISFVITIATS